MKNLIALVMLTLAMTVSAADVQKKPAAPSADKKAPVKKEKCVPSKEVVCQDSLKGKTRPTPKKKEESPK